MVHPSRIELPHIYACNSGLKFGKRLGAYEIKYALGLTNFLLRDPTLKKTQIGHLCHALGVIFWLSVLQELLAWLLVKA